MSEKIEATNIKLTSQQISRIDALIEPMTEAARRMGMRDMSRAAVIRAAVERGLTVLETEFQPTPAAQPDPEEGDTTT